MSTNQFKDDFEEVNAVQAAYRERFERAFEAAPPGLRAAAKRAADLVRACDRMPVVDYLGRLDTIGYRADLDDLAERVYRTVIGL